MNIQQKLDKALKKLENYSLMELKTIIEGFGYNLDDASHIVSDTHYDIDMKIANSVKHTVCLDISYFSSNDESILEYAA